MKLTDRQIERIKRILDLIYRNKRTLVALSCVVVFITTYMLILPALTLEKEEAAEQGGISLETSATEEVTAEEAAGIGQDETAEIVHEKPMNDQSKDSDSAETVKEPSDEVASSGKVEGDPDGAKTTETLDPLTFEGENFTIAVADEASVLPSGARIDVQEIIKDDEEYTEQYEELYTESLKALQKEEGKNKVADLGFAKFYDITLLDGETAIQPDSSVDVTIEYEKELQKELSAKNSENVRIIHFAQDEKTGELKLEILDSEAVEVNTSNKDKLTDTTFQADGFSVYAIVYTVDFHYEINGKKCDFGIPGGGFVSLEHLMQVLLTDADSEYDEAVALNSINVNDTTKQFVEDVESVSFSAPDLVWVGKAETNTTVGALKDAHNLDVQYSADLTEEQIAEIDAQTVKTGDWALISLRPFDTEETLTVTMKNGDKFTVVVTDAHEIEDSSSETIDRDKSYLICYQVGNTYYLLKNDGTVDSSHNPNTFENLNSTYCWSFNYVFQEKHLEDTLTYNYYLIRPIDNKSKTIALNEEGKPLVQQSNNNVAVVPAGDGFNLIGYNEVKLNFADGAFFADELPAGENGIVVHIYEMDTLPTYEYTARSSDEERGTVTIAGGTQMTETDGSHYYDAESTSDKKNAGAITATPVDHRDGQGDNKWLFDHWEQDGIPLDTGQYPATIAINSLPIPFNGSNLIAYFKQNPQYDVPDNEKNPSSFEDMSNWLDDLTEKPVPLDRSATDKTAEVYDYENRIYRVDLTTKPNFRTFNGNVDMAFCMDVSNSMYFPSKLEEYREDFSIYRINDYGWWGDNRTWLDRSRGFNNPYYVIGDETDTATVFKLYYKWDYNVGDSTGGSWVTIDASKPELQDNGTKNYWAIGHEDFELNWSKNVGKTYPLHAGDTIDSTYTVYNAGDDGNNRFHYLSSSFNSATSDLTDIKSLLEVAGDDSPEVRVAYNTFNKDLGNQRQDFRSAEPLNVNLSYASGGGTRPDQAFNDAKSFDWKGNDRYVVFITDGAPQGVRTGTGGDPSGTTQADIDGIVRAAAQALKDEDNVKFITIGLSMDKVPHGKRLLYDLADNDSEGTKMFYMAESASDLPNILRQVINTIMDDAIVFSDVTDTVGEAFYPVDKSTGLKLYPGDMIDIEGRKVTDSAQAAGIIQPDGKTVKWNHQALDPENGWHGTIYVKAQEDLIGGNAVKTNGDAGIVATGYRMGDKEYSFTESPLNPDKLKSISVDFETPRVNVNELIFPSTTTEWTVYLGTEVDPEEHIRKMYEGLLVTGVVNTDAEPDNPDYIHYPLVPNSIEDDRTTGEHGSALTFSLSDEILEAIKAAPALSALYVTNNELNWDKFLEDIQKPNGVTVPYHKYGTEGEDSNIQIKLTKETIGTEKDINESPHETTELNGTDDQGNSVPAEKYVLTVQYNPDYDHVLPLGQGGHGHIDYHTGTYGSMYQGHASGRETSTSTQDINVYAKRLEIQKVDQEHEIISNNPAVFGLYREATSDEMSDSSIEKISLDGLSGSYIKVQTLTTTNDGTVVTEPLKLLKSTPNYDVPYYLKEEQAPAGFNTLEEILKVSIDIGDEWTKKPNGPTTQTKPNPYEVSDWVQNSTILVKALNDADSGAAIRVTPPGEGITYDHENDTTDASVTYQIVNDAGVVLPESGGIGTTIFYVLGSMLVLGCGIYLIARRRIA